jgi:hypothetical protein
MVHEKIFILGAHWYRFRNASGDRKPWMSRWPRKMTEAKRNDNIVPVDFGGESH